MILFLLRNHGREFCIKISFQKILIFSAVSVKGILCVFVFAFVDAEENCF